MIPDGWTIPLQFPTSTSLLHYTNEHALRYAQRLDELLMAIDPLGLDHHPTSIIVQVRDGSAATVALTP